MKNTGVPDVGQSIVSDVGQTMVPDVGQTENTY